MKTMLFTVWVAGCGRVDPAPQKGIFIIAVWGCGICPAAASASPKNVFAMPQSCVFAGADMRDLLELL
jgi:hypothetical protein